jgi:transposase InsO family protein
VASRGRWFEIARRGALRRRRRYDQTRWAWSDPHPDGSALWVLTLPLGGRTDAEELVQGQADRRRRARGGEWRPRHRRLPAPAEELERLAGARRRPASIVCDNGPEFTSRVSLAWTQRRDDRLLFTRPGKPVENAFVESFDAHLRDECLTEQWFLSLANARELTEGWRQDYHVARAHSGLAGRTPAECPLVCGCRAPLPDP